MMMNGEKNSFVTIFLIICGLLGLAGCSPLVQDGTELPVIVPTPFASSTTAPIKATNTATAVPTTVSLEPTATLSGLDPAEASTIFEETFSDNRNNWQTDSPLGTITEGRYRHSIDCPNSHASPHCGRFIKVPFPFPKNFRIELETKLSKASSGAEVLVGFQVRRSDIHYYFISYSITESNYQMSYISQNGISELIPATQTDLIKTAVGETNHLGIEARGFLLTPLINGQEIAPANNGKIRDAGDSYLVILITRGHSAELEFDNLLIQEAE